MYNRYRFNLPSSYLSVGRQFDRNSYSFNSVILVSSFYLKSIFFFVAMICRHLALLILLFQSFKMLFLHDAYLNINLFRLNLVLALVIVDRVCMYHLFCYLFHHYSLLHYLRLFQKKSVSFLLSSIHLPLVYLQLPIYLPYTRLFLIVHRSIK